MNSELFNTLMEDAELFDDIMTNDIIDDGGITLEGAGGARGKYIQTQQDKIKRIEEEIAKLKKLESHALGDKKKQYKDRIITLEEEKSECRHKIVTYGDADDFNSKDKDPRGAFRSDNTDAKNNWNRKVDNESKHPNRDSVHHNINERSKD